MMAEEMTCNGAGEAPKAEFAREKVVVAALPEEKAARERKGEEDIDGPFLIVNGGDSNGHSDRGSDQDRPDEDSLPDLDDVPGSNAALKVAVGGDHGAAEEGEVGAPGPALGASLADGGDRAFDRSEGKPSSDCVTEEVVQQEVVVEEDGRAAALASGGREPAIASASEAPAVDCEVEGKEATVDGSAVADVAEAVVHQEASTELDGDAAVMSPKSSCAAMESEVIRDDSKEQNTAADVVVPQELVTVGASALVENGHLCDDMRADLFVAATEPDSQEDAAVESCRHDVILICTDIKSEAYGDDSKQEENNADVVEVMWQGVDRADALMPNGHLCIDTQADSSEDTTESENHANESKLTEVAESVEGDAASGEQDATDASQTNGHICVALSADFCIVASESNAHSFEMDGREIDPEQEEAPKTEAQALEGGLKLTKRNCAGSDEKLIGEEVDTDGHTSVGVADASGEQEARPLQVETEEQPICGASMEHGTMVVDEAEIKPITGNASKEKSSDVAVNQVKPVNLNVDELLVVDDDQPSFDPSCESARLDKPGCISKKDDSSEIIEDSRSVENQLEICNAECSSRIVNEDPSPINTSDECSSGIANDVPHLTEEPCLSDKSCNTIDYENGNESAKSSVGVETKCVEALLTEHDNGHHASGDHAQIIGPHKIYIIKVPKFAGDDLWNKIQAAQAHLDQLTQERDAINHLRQKQKAVCDEYWEKLEAARREEREARADLNSVRSVLGKLHQANSVEELDERIAKKERTLQHETISLKEEKLLIKEINELKAQRKQLSATMGSKAINEAFDQKDHIHERHKELKKDSYFLFTNLKLLEENTRKIHKSFEDERTALRKLTEEHRGANEIRQKAYIEWTVLRSEPSKKNEYFFEYRDARNATETFRANGDTNGLKSHCNSQIERVMAMWNQNEDFRKQYVESNKVSTLKRLGTHDGRRLGLDEDPPVIPSRRPSSIYPLSASSPEVPTLASIPAPVLAAPAAFPAEEDSFPVLPAPQTSKRVKSKASGSSAQIDNNSVTISEAKDLKQTLNEKARLLEEQLQLARTTEELAWKEELRKERDAAEKEQLRLEQKAKAKEAEERKRRKAEKDKERAEFKARKEAEEREKKKANKDKKKGTIPADSSTIGNSNAAALATADTDSYASDNPREVEVSQPAAPKRLSRPAAAIKQLNRLQPMPAPLRNRGRRKLRQYILIAAAVLSVLALFVVGNYIPRLKSAHS